MVGACIRGGNSSETDVTTQAQDNSTLGQTQDSQTDAITPETKTDTQAENADVTDIGEDTSSSGGTLVVYFSCTGTTKGVAETVVIYYSCNGSG